MTSISCPSCGYNICVSCGEVINGECPCCAFDINLFITQNSEVLPSEIFSCPLPGGE